MNRLRWRVGCVGVVVVCGLLGGSSLSFAQDVAPPPPPTTVPGRVPATTAPDREVVAPTSVAPATTVPDREVLAPTSVALEPVPLVPPETSVVVKDLCVEDPTACVAPTLTPLPEPASLVPFEATLMVENSCAAAAGSCGDVSLPAPQPVQSSSFAPTSVVAPAELALGVVFQVAREVCDAFTFCGVSAGLAQIFPDLAGTQGSQNLPSGCHYVFFPIINAWVMVCPPPPKPSGGGSGIGVFLVRAVQT